MRTKISGNFGLKKMHTPQSKKLAIFSQSSKSGLEEDDSDHIINRWNIPPYVERPLRQMENVYGIYDGKENRHSILTWQEMMYEDGILYKF